MAISNSRAIAAGPFAVTSHIEWRAVISLIIVMTPLLVALFYWLSLGSDERVQIGGLAGAYVDVGGTATLDDVMAQPDLFSRPDGNAPNRGVRARPQTAFWLRLSIDDIKALLPVGTEAPYSVSMEEPRFRTVDLYAVSAGRNVSTLKFQRGVDDAHRFPVFQLSSAELEADALYARITTGSSMRATLFLTPADKFEALYARSTMGLVLLIGMMAMAVAYLVPLGLVLKRGIYIALAAAMVFAALYVASDQAVLETYFLPGALVFSRAASLSAPVLFYGAFLSFAVRFLNHERPTPKLQRLADILAMVLLLIGAAAFVDGVIDAGLLRRFLPYVGVGGVGVLAVLLAFSALRAPMRAALFVVLWLPLVATGTFRLLLDINAADIVSPVALHGIYFGFAVSLLMFSIATPVELYRREARLRQRATTLLQRLESFSSLAGDIYVELDAAGKVVHLAAGKTEAGDPLEDSAAVDALPGHAIDIVTEAARNGATVHNQIFAVGTGSQTQWFSMSGSTTPHTGHFRAVLRNVSIAIEAEQQRQQERQLISLGSLAATVAHEINNVIQPIINMSKGLRGHIASSAQAARMLDLIDLAAQQAVVVVDQILSVGARTSDRPAQRRAINHAVEDAIATLQMILPPSVSLVSSIHAVPNVLVRPGDILQILINVVANARRAVGEVGTITIELRPHGAGALLAVIDDGEGMSHEMLSRATQPFVTTKPAGQVAGIGLIVVNQMVTAHGGIMTLSSELGHGTRVEMIFPSEPGSPE